MKLSQAEQLFAEMRAEIDELKSEIEALNP